MCRAQGELFLKTFFDCDQLKDGAFRSRGHSAKFLPQARNESMSKFGLWFGCYRKTLAAFTQDTKRKLAENSRTTISK